MFFFKMSRHRPTSADTPRAVTGERVWVAVFWTLLVAGIVLYVPVPIGRARSEEHTSELQSHSFISYAVFCLKKKKKHICQYSSVI